MENTHIGWSDDTFNPWRGCKKVSPGCTNCYADAQSKRNPKVLGVWGPHGQRVLAEAAQWWLPPKWDRAAAKAGVRRRVFCLSLGDVFDDWPGQLRDHEWRPLTFGGRPYTLLHARAPLLELIGETPHLDWLLLTKHIEGWGERLREVAAATYGGGAPARRWLGGEPPPNVWLGMSAENQAWADKRLRLLLATPASLRFVSCEPLIGPVDLSPWLAGLDWVIVGGESGPGWRPMDLAWMGDIIEQCRAAEVPVFVKQDSAFRNEQQGRIPDEWWALKQHPASPAA
jgi:protein gp37